MKNEMDAFTKALKKTRYKCGHCGRQFKDKPQGVGVVPTKCPKCGTCVDASHIIGIFHRTRKYGKPLTKWGLVPAWGPLYVVLYLLAWRLGIRTIGAGLWDRIKIIARWKTLTKREEDRLVDKVAEATAKKMGVVPGQQVAAVPPLELVNNPDHARAYIGKEVFLDSPFRGRVRVRLEHWFRNGIDGESPEQPWVAGGEKCHHSQLTLIG